MQFYEVNDFKSVTALGVTGRVDGRTIQVGSERLVEPQFLGDEGLAADSYSRLGSVLFVSIEGHIAGFISVSDKIKDSAKSTVEELGRLGIEVKMISGDNETIARLTGNELGILDAIGNVLPHEKAAKIKELQSMGKIVAMAGDGVNDAPALAQADVGIAFASGTDVAIESADITLLKPDLDGILKAINLSKATMSNIRQNLFFAFAYNIIGVPIAAGVLFPVFGLLLSPMIASLAMTFSSVSVITNALRLRKTEL